MPRNYKRKTSRGDWSQESMTAALDAVKNGMAYKKASKEYLVPIMSLKRRAKAKNKIAVGAVKYLGGKRTVFTKEQENELVDHIKDMETRMYGLTKKELLSLAYQLAENNEIPHSFRGGKAGNDWLKGFRQRHPDITLRAPESTSTARARAFNKPVVDKFYATLKSVQDAKNIPAHRIYNVDETSVCTVPTKNTKVFAKTGRKQVARVTSAERGVTTTAVICMSASGTFVPPMFIFRRIRMKIELMEGAPPGSAWACNASGWMKLEVFTQWFEHFLRHTKPSEEDPVMLILDGHLSHTKNLDVILKARANHVTIVCLPPHCTHKMQPLDVSVMYPLSVYHNQSLEKWMNNNPGRPVTVFQIAKIFGEAYLKAAIPTNAINGFAKTGICPLNPEVFTEVDFIAAATTENELDEEQPELPEPPRRRASSDTEFIDGTSPSLLERSASPDTQRLLATSVAELDLESPRAHKTPLSVNESVPIRSPLSPIPSTSRAVNHSETSLDDNNIANFAITPASLKPLPQIVGKRNTLKRKTTHTTVLTSTPYKNYLEEENSKKTEKENKKILNKTASKKTKKGKGVGKGKSNKRKKSIYNTSESEEDDTECLYCTEKFSSDTKDEGWIKCCACGKWGHEACAGVEGDDAGEFICDICNVAPAKRRLNL